MTVLGLPEQASGSREWSATAYWLPGETLAVLRLKQSDRGMRGSSESNSFQTVKFESIRVSILIASKNKDRSVAEQTANSVRKLGDFYVTAGNTRDPRAETTIYTAKGFEKSAHQIAETLAGAKVEALTWKADADIVVALPDPTP